MAIESLNSAMVFQAQPVKKIAEPQKVAAETQKNDYSIDVKKQIDATTALVSNVSDKPADRDQSDQMNSEQLRKAVEKINKNAIHSEVQFGIHEDTNRVTIRIVDKDTRETIKELPPEKTLDMIAKAWELAGLLVDERR